MKFLLAKKNSMTQVYTDDGRAIPATLLDVGVIVVTQVKNKEKDGYEAIQVGFGEKKEKNISKSVKGHTKGLGNFASLREFPTTGAPEGGWKVGDKIELGAFAPGDTVEVSGVSKGKGFQSVIKLHNFKGGPRSHGQKHSEREPGSIGGGLRNKVPKGMRMAGRMGGDKITVKNLEIVEIIPEANQILVSGAVPGKRGTVLELRSKN